ncbi:MAG: WXG100 family type VII secretion target [Acidimicrobiales bacterium]
MPGGDWSPLAARDPIPGDPDAIMGLVGRLDTTRAVIEEQVARLRGIDAAAFWTGDAADNFRKHKEDLPPRLDLLIIRYQRVSGALSGYAPDLDQAQQMARRALEQARQAEADLQRAEQGIDAMESHYRREQTRAGSYNETNPDSPPYDPEPWHGPNYYGHRTDAEADMGAARQLLEQATELRDRAANAAADEVDEAINDDLENEGGLFAGLKRLAASIVDALPIEELAAVAGVAAAVLAIAALLVPGVGWLASAALIAGLVSFGLDTVLFAAGDKSAWEWGLSAFGVALGGAGALASRLAKGATVTSTVARQLTVVDEAMEVAVRAGQAGELITEITAVARVTQLTEIAQVTSLSRLGRVLTGIHNFAEGYGVGSKIAGAAVAAVRLPDTIETIFQTDIGTPNNDSDARYRAQTIEPITIDQQLPGGRIGGGVPGVPGVPGGGYNPRGIEVVRVDDIFGTRRPLGEWREIELVQVGGRVHQ